jgi:cation diffusion facilitator family transporter
VKERRFAAWLSLGVGLVMLVLKLGAYLLTDSFSILSDALESVSHVLVSSFVAFAVLYAEKPVDKDHPYGHGKIEGFSIGMEGGLIALAGVGILWETGRGFFDGHEPQNLATGMWLIGLSAIINVALAIYLFRIGKKHNAKIFTADAHHILSDSVTSGGILIGVGLVELTGWTPLDSIVAVVIALNLLRVGHGLIKEAITNLLDEIEPGTIQSIVKVLNEIRDSDWKDIHMLRVHRNGTLYHVDFHMVVPGGWTVYHAHQAMDRIEAEILRKLGGGSVLIHLDPEEQEPQADETLIPEGDFTVESVTRFGEDPSQEPFRNPDHVPQLPHTGNS